MFTTQARSPSLLGWRVFNVPVRVIFVYLYLAISSLSVIILLIVSNALESEVTISSLRFSFYLNALVYYVSGVWLFILQRGDRVRTDFLFFTTSASVWFITLSIKQLSPTLLIFSAIYAGIASASLMRLALYFPNESFFVVRFPILGWLFYPLTGLLPVLSCYWLIVFGIPTAGVLTRNLEYFFVGLSVIFFALMELIRRYTLHSPFDREQAQWVLVGSVLSFGSVVLWLISYLLGSKIAFTPFIVIPLIIFPLTIAYSIHRRGFLDSKHLSARIFLYSLLTVIGFAGYILLVSGLMLLVEELFFSHQPYWMGALAVLLSIAFLPLRDHLQKSIDKKFYRAETVYQQIIKQFSTELLQAKDIYSIVLHLRRTIEEALMPSPFHIYILDAQGYHYVPIANDEGKSSDVWFIPSSGLVRVLSRCQGPIFIDEKTSSPMLSQSDRARLSLLNTNLFIPLYCQQRLLGWLALGARGSEQSYRKEDLTFLEELWERATSAISQAGIVADIERHVHELSILMRLAEGINITLSFDDLLELVFAQTSQVIPTKDFYVVLKDQWGKHFYHAFYVENDERLRERENRPLPEDFDLESVVIKSQKPLVTQNYLIECRARNILPKHVDVLSWMGVPLKTASETIGAISLCSRDVEVTFNSEQLDLLQAIANLAAGALEKVRLLRETELRAHQLSALNEIARKLSSNLDMNTLLESVLENAVNLLECNEGVLWVRDRDADQIEEKVSIGRGERSHSKQHSETEIVLVQKVIENNEPLLGNLGLSGFDFPSMSSPENPSGSNLLIVPMRLEDGLGAAIELIHKRNGLPFTIADKMLLEAFAAQAVVAIRNAYSYMRTDQALAAYLEELSILQRIDRELNVSLDLEHVMRITLEWCVRQAVADAGLIGIVSGEGVRVLASHGYSDELNIFVDGLIPLDFAPFSVAIKNGQVQKFLVQNQGNSGDGWNINKAMRNCLFTITESQVVVPIRREAKVIALMLLESRQKDGFSDEIMQFLSRLSDHAAIAISNAQLYATVQAANLAKSEFVSLAAHELKNPLTSIKGYSDLLMAGAVGEISPAQANFLATIRSNADRMSTLVSDLQDISRIEAGQLRLQFGTVQFSEVVEEVARSLQKQIEEKGQTLDIRIPQDLPLVWGDRTRLIQIMTNLVSNAHKYTSSGGSISVRVNHVPNQWDSSGAPWVIHVAVQDNGIGIREEDKRKIFQQFFRSEDPKVREVTGTGLGLSITKNLVEMQGGKIWFESTLHQGTTFYFTIPVAEAV